MNKNFSHYFEGIKDADEKILWTARPEFWPYVISGMSSVIGVAIMLISWIAMSFNIENPDDRRSIWLWGLIPIAVAVYASVKNFFTYNKTFYAYSNKRVIIRSGVIGTDYKIIDYDKILDMAVSVSGLEKAYGVGTIRFFTGETKDSDGTTEKVYDNWEAIQNPYEVFRELKQVTSSVKSNYTFPNAYANPETSPNYQIS